MCRQCFGGRGVGQSLAPHILAPPIAVSNLLRRLGTVLLAQRTLQLSKITEPVRASRGLMLNRPVVKDPDLAAGDVGFADYNSVWSGFLCGFSLLGS